MPKNFDDLSTCSLGIEASQEDVFSSFLESGFEYLIGHYGSYSLTIGNIGTQGTCASTFPQGATGTTEHTTTTFRVPLRVSRFYRSRLDLRRCCW
jgi:hypothetical protein